MPLCSLKIVDVGLAVLSIWRFSVDLEPAETSGGPEAAVLTAADVPEHAAVDRQSRGDAVTRTGDGLVVVELVSSPWRRDVTGSRGLDRGVARQRSARPGDERQGTVETQAAPLAV